MICKTSSWWYTRRCRDSSKIKDYTQKSKIFEMISVPFGTGDIPAVWYCTYVRWYMPSAYGGTDIMSYGKAVYHFCHTNPKTVFNQKTEHSIWTLRFLSVKCQKNLTGHFAHRCKWAGKADYSFSKSDAGCLHHGHIKSSGRGSPS